MAMNFSNVGYDGTLFGDFHVRKDTCAGPGWFIYGRNCHKYGRNPDGKGSYVKLCGFVREGRARGFNFNVRIGWPRKRDAVAALAEHLAAYPFLDKQGQ